MLRPQHLEFPHEAVIGGERIQLPRQHPRGAHPKRHVRARKPSARAVRQRGAVEPVFVEETAALPETLARVLEDRDLVLTMGAGDVGAIARGLPDALAEAVAALEAASA